jgi:FHA domain
MNNSKNISELQRFTIGRALDNAVVLTHPNISRCHAVLIICTSTIYLIEDIESKHGVFVNGDRVKRKLISTEDNIGIATHLYKVSDLLPAITIGKSKNNLDYTKEFDAMQELYEQYLTFKAEEFNIANAIKKANEKLRLGAVASASTLGLLSHLAGTATGVSASGGIAASASVASAALGGITLASAAPALGIIAACGLGMLIPAIGSRFLGEDEKLNLPRLHFANSWKCPKCGDKTAWMGKSWVQLAKQKKCAKCDAIWVK